jgi:hypothetical protein
MIALAEKRGKLDGDRSDENVGSKTRLADSPSNVGTGEGKAFRRLISERLLQATHASPSSLIVWRSGTPATCSA